MFGRQRKDECHRIGKLFSPYLDNRLDPVERDAVSYHIEICENCRHDLSSLEMTVQLLHRIPVATPPRSFTLSQSPTKQLRIPFAIPVTSWLQGMEVVVAQNLTRLRIATAIATILLLVMVAGDLTGTFHDDVRSEAKEPTEMAEAIVPARSSETQPSTALTEEIASSEMSTVPVISEETGDMPQMEEAAPPKPSSVPAGSSGIAGKVTGAGEDIPPISSPDAPKSEDINIAQGAIRVPGDAEAALLSNPPLALKEEAYPWLRPLEIVLSAIVIILIGIGLITQKRNWPLIFRNK